MTGHPPQAYDPAALMREAEEWKTMLAHDPDAQLPLVVAWTAWRWADAARRIVAAGERDAHLITVMTLQAHARCLLDLLDAGHVEEAVQLHRRVTQGLENLHAMARRRLHDLDRWLAAPAQDPPAMRGPLGHLSRIARRQPS